MAQGKEQLTHSVTEIVVVKAAIKRTQRDSLSILTLRREDITVRQVSYTSLLITAFLAAAARAPSCDPGKRPARLQS